MSKEIFSVYVRVVKVDKDEQAGNRVGLAHTGEMLPAVTLKGEISGQTQRSLSKIRPNALLICRRVGCWGEWSNDCCQYYQTQ